MRKLVALSLLALCLSLAGSPDARAQRRVSGFTSLKLFAESEKSAYALGEPLTVRVRLANLSDTAVAARPDLDPAYGAIQVHVSRNGGEFKRYLGPGWGTKDRPAGAPVSLSPGDVVRCDVTLMFHNAVPGRDDLLDSAVPVDEAGSYLIRVELYDDVFDRRIRAPVVSVEVGYPQGEAGPAVWQAVQEDDGLAYFMQTGDARCAEGVVKTAEQLVQRFPGDKLDKHLALALGRHHLGQERAGAAVGYLKEAAAAAEPGSSLRARALLELTKSYATTGDVEEALKISDAAAEEFDDGEVRQEFQRLGSKLRRAEKNARPREVQHPPVAPAPVSQP